MKIRYKDLDRNMLNELISTFTAIATNLANDRVKEIYNLSTCRLPNKFKKDLRETLNAYAFQGSDFYCEFNRVIEREIEKEDEFCSTVKACLREIEREDIRREMK